MKSQLKNAIKVDNLKSILNSKLGVRYLDIRVPVRVSENATAVPRDSEEAKTAEFCVCPRLGTPSIYSGNVVTKCFKCKSKIFHRPDVPRNPKLKFVCIECAEEIMK